MTLDHLYRQSFEVEPLPASDDEPAEMRLSA